MSHVQIFTDGACRGNPGPGGWGALLRFGGEEKTLFGGEQDTTNNRMELTAVIEALGALKRPCDVTLTSDSTYVLKGIQEWMPNWKKRGWKTASKKPVKNPQKHRCPAQSLPAPDLPNLDQFSWWYKWHIPSSCFSLAYTS